jgi:hypothetical protein
MKFHTTTWFGTMASNRADSSVFYDEDALPSTSINARLESNVLMTSLPVLTRSNSCMLFKDDRCRPGAVEVLTHETLFVFEFCLSWRLVPRHVGFS